jgi:ATP phosphoribosyltransferase
MSGHLTVALPSKGSLHGSTLALLERCFMRVTRDSGGRSYSGRIAGLPGAAVLYARADEIPEIVRSGRAQVGITGLDLVMESQDGEASSKRLEVLIEDLAYGGAALEVGVPVSWIDVSSLADLVEVAHDVRTEHARPLLVATKFPNLTRRHFIRNGLSDFRLVQSVGATEAAPRSGTADIIVDLVSSGATFDANGLTTVSGGLVLQSQACLIASSSLGVWSSSAAVDELEHFGELIEAAIRAQTMRMLQATFPSSTDELPKSLSNLLAEIKLYRSDGDHCELVATFDCSAVHQVLAETKQAGALQAIVLECDIMAEYASTRIGPFVATLTDAVS